MMTTRSGGRKPKAAQQDITRVTVEVTAPHAVYWDGEQRSGTLDDVPLDTATEWQRHGWATSATSDDTSDDH